VDPDRGRRGPFCWRSAHGARPFLFDAMAGGRAWHMPKRRAGRLLHVRRWANPETYADLLDVCRESRVTRDVSCLNRPARSRGVYARWWRIVRRRGTPVALHSATRGTELSCSSGTPSRDRSRRGGITSSAWRAAVMPRVPPHAGWAQLGDVRGAEPDRNHSWVG